MPVFYLISTNLITGKNHKWDSGEFESRPAAVEHWAPAIAKSPLLALMDVTTVDQ